MVCLVSYDFFFLVSTNDGAPVPISPGATAFRGMCACWCLGGRHRTVCSGSGDGGDRYRRLERYLYAHSVVGESE